MTLRLQRSRTRHRATPGPPVSAGITTDPSTPTPVRRAYGTGTTVTSGTFTPPAGSYIVVMVAVGWGTEPSTTTAPAITASDSVGSTGWQTRMQLWVKSTQMAIFTCRVGSSTARTVTVTSSSATGKSMLAAYRVLTGVDADQTGAASGSSTTLMKSAVTKTDPRLNGRLYEVGASGTNNTQVTPTAVTGSIDVWQDTTGSGDDLAIGAGTPTQTQPSPWTVNMGWSPAGRSIALEILPATTSAPPDPGGGTSGGPTTGGTWKMDYTQANVVAAGCVDDSFQRENAAGVFNDNSVPWPATIVTAPAGMGGRAAIFTIPNNYMRYEMVPNIEFGAGETHYFGDAFYLAAGGLSTTATNWQVIQQIRQSSAQGSPPVAIEVLGGNLMLTGGYGIDGGTPTRLAYQRTLLTGVQTQVRYNVVYRINNFSTAENTSSIDVWVNGTQVLTGYVIPPPTLVGGTSYWKLGVYHDPANPGGTIYHAGTAVGDTFAAVDPSLSTSGTGKPTVNAGADTSVAAGSAFARTATESGGAPTSRSWQLVAPSQLGEGTTVGTAALLNWTPGSSPAGDNNIRQPVFEEMAYEMVSTAENSTLDWNALANYTYIEDIGDGRGYTGGIIGFTSGPGDMLTLIQYYTQIAPGNILAKYINALQQVTNSAESQWTTKSHQLLDPNFVPDWRNAATNDPKFRQAQRDEKDRVYWQPAFNQALSDGVGGLGLALLYDILVNHGPGTDSQSFGGIVAAAQAAAPPPSRGGNEKNYLQQLLNKRVAVLQAWGDYQTDGRQNIYQPQITASNLTLTGNVSWSVYGDPFTINRPNPPVEFRKGVYTLRYTATNTQGTGTDDVVVTVT